MLIYHNNTYYYKTWGSGTLGKY